MIIFYSLVRLIIPPVFSTASRLTNPYHFSGNVPPDNFTVSQALSVWQFFYDFSSACLTTFYDFSSASRLKIPCTFSGASRLRILLSVSRFAPDKAFRACGPHGQVWTHFSHLAEGLYVTRFIPRWEKWVQTWPWGPQARSALSLGAWVKFSGAKRLKKYKEFSGEKS